MPDSIEVRLVAKEPIERMAAEVTLPDGRYHFWFNGRTMELCADILYKNPPRGGAKPFKTRTLNPSSARCAKLIARMKQQIIDKQMVENAIAELAKQKAVQERRAHVRRLTRAFWAKQMRSARVPVPPGLTAAEFHEESAVIAEQVVG